MIVSATAPGSFVIAAGSLSIAPFPELHDELDQASVLEVRYDLGSVGLDVGVQQEPHAGFGQWRRYSSYFAFPPRAAAAQTCRRRPCGISPATRISPGRASKLPGAAS